MIPAILHQTAPSAELSAAERSWRASWARRNPGLDMRFYDDAALRAFVATHYPEYLDTLDGFSFGVMKADFFRYLVVHRFGGLYADTDMECRRPHDRLLAMGGALFGVEARVTMARQRELGYARPWQIANCVFGAEAGHPFLGAIIERVAQLARAHPSPSKDEIEDITGPRMLTRLFYERDFPGLNILAQTVWLPSRSYPDVWPVNANIHAIHHFAGSWKGGGSAKSWPRRWIERDIPPNPWPRRLIAAMGKPPR